MFNKLASKLTKQFNLITLLFGAYKMANLITTTTVEKTFTFVGVSDLNGLYKARFANSADRVKVLVKNGHTDIRLFALDGPMTKYDAVMAIKDMEEFADIDAQQAFDDFLSKVKAPIVAKEAVVEEDYSDAINALEADLALA